MLTRGFVLLLLSLLVIFNSQAQTDALVSNQKKDIFELSLNDLLKIKVSTASKKEEEINEAPGLLTVISREEIDGFSAVNLGEVLERVVGSVVLSPILFTKQSYSLRGQEITPYNNHVLFLLNGRPLRDPITGGMNAAILATFPLESLEKIEIIRGPGSVLYGSAAYSGVVNLITKNPKKEGVSGSAFTSYGSYNQLNSGGHLVLKKKEFQAHLGLNYIKDDGPELSFFDYDSLYHTAKFHQTGYALAMNVLFKGLQINGYASRFDPYTLKPGYFWSDTSINIHNSYMLDIGYTQDIGEKMDVSLNFTSNWQVWEFWETDHVNTSAKSHQVELTSRYQPIKQINFIFGGGVEMLEWEGKLLIENHQSLAFAYVQMDYKIHDLLKVISGIQFNKIEGLDNDFVPRLGILSNFNKHFGMKLLYSEAFRRGYPIETHLNHPQYQGSPELEPEKIRTYEVQLFYISDKSTSSLSFYNSTMLNLITRADSITYLKYLNEGEFHFCGLEYEGKYSLHKNILATVALSYQTNEKDGIKNAALHPNTMLKIGLLYSQNHWDIGIFNNFMSKGYSTTIVNPGSWEINKPHQSYNLLSAKISYKAPLKNTQLKVSTQFFNILNQEVNYVDFPNKTLNTLVPHQKGIHGNVIVHFTF